MWGYEQNQRGSVESRYVVAHYHESDATQVGQGAQSKLVILTNPFILVYHRCGGTLLDVWLWLQLGKTVYVHLGKF